MSSLTLSEYACATLQGKCYTGESWTCLIPRPHQYKAIRAGLGFESGTVTGQAKVATSVSDP